MREHCVLALLSVLWLCSPVAAEQWAEEMFETTSHDFGSVARNSLTEFRFTIANIYEEDVRIVGVRTSCACTTPRLTKHLLKTYEQGAVVARFNTETFLGRKSATLTVTFDKPLDAEVQLHVSGDIRGDVVFSPGSVQLGNVPYGTPVERKVSVRCPGNANWQITRLHGGGDYVSAEAVETRRDWQQTDYELRVRLEADAPLGYIRDHLMLVTVNGRQAEIPLPIVGRVIPAVTVSPTPLFMGVLRPGEQVKKQLVVRGGEPFRIKAVTTDGDCFKFDIPSDAKAKSFHLIPVTFVAGEKPGKVTQTIRIKTDLGGQVTKLSASAMVSQP